LIESPDHKHQLLGYFGRSLIHANWSWLHPNFRNYSRCLMACGDAGCRRSAMMPGCRRNSRPSGSPSPRE
jgi:hypothetical protein